MGKPAIDLRGIRFGRLRAVSRGGINRHGAVLWRCRCDCGKSKTVNGENLRRGHVKSCGCYSKEWHANVCRTVLAQRKIKHGHSVHGKTTEYMAYLAAQKRCCNRKGKSWKHYGGRGIRFLFGSFQQFIAEVGTKPQPKSLYSLDRIDNDGHYASGNVRWATRSQQARNRRACGNKAEKGHVLIERHDLKPI